MADSSTDSQFTSNNDNAMRYLFLAHYVADNLSADLMEYTLAKNGISWDDFIKQPYIVKNSNKRLPNEIKNADTTALMWMLDYQNEPPKDPQKRMYKYHSKTDEFIEALRGLRNFESHKSYRQQSLMTLTSEEFSESYKKIEKVFVKCEAENDVFPNIPSYKKFVESNKGTLVTDLAQTHDIEMKRFLSSKLASDNAQLIQLFNQYQKIQVNIGQIIVNQTVQLKQDFDEDKKERTEDSDKPRPEIEPDRSSARTSIASSLFHCEKIVGRDVELEEIRKEVENNNNPVLLISGPPGVGKTSLAVTYAKEMDKKGQFKCFSVNFQDLRTEHSEDLKQEITSRICQAFIPKQTTFALKDSVQRKLAEDKSLKLLFILDSIDMIQENRKNGVLGEVLRDLCGNDGRVKFICTSRLQELQQTKIASTFIVLKEIKYKSCYDWLQNELESQETLGERLIETLASKCKGIPLLMKIFASAVKHNYISSQEDLDDFGDSEDLYDQLDEALQWSFKAFNSKLLTVLKCSSVFAQRFHLQRIQELFNNFQTRGGGQEPISLKQEIDKCSNASLIAIESSNPPIYYMHSYIKEYVTKKYRDEVETLDELFVLTYFHRLLDLTADQLQNGKQREVVEEVLQDAHNFHKFMNAVVSRKSFSQESLKIMRIDHVTSPYLWLAAMWFLHNFNQFFYVLIPFCEAMVELFKKTELTNLQVLTECFIYHISCMREGSQNMNRARKILMSAEGKIASVENNFVQAYFKYSKLRLNQKRIERIDDHTNEELYSEAEKLYCKDLESQSNTKVKAVLWIELLELHTGYNHSTSSPDELYEKLNSALGLHIESGMALFKRGKAICRKRCGGDREKAEKLFRDAYRVLLDLGSDVTINNIMILYEWGLMLEGKTRLRKWKAAIKQMEDNGLKGLFIYEIIKKRITSEN